MRALAVPLLALALVLPGFAFADDVMAAPEAWREKADPELLEALQREAPGAVLRVLVQGDAMPMPEQALPDRDAWRAWWAAHSAPFLGAVRAAAADVGAVVSSEVAPVNAAFVRIAAADVPELLGNPAIRTGALDREDAVSIYDGEPGPAVNLDQTIAKVQAGELWAQGYKGEGITLTVLDTGVRATHETFRNADGTSRVTAWADVTEPVGGRCATPCDINGHGTHVTSTAAGSNAFNPAAPNGVAPKANLWHVRIFQGGSSAWEVTQAGLQRAFDMGATLTSNSWGGGCGAPGSGGYVTGQLASNLQAAGMYSVFAAGNAGGGGVSCPGQADNVLTVAAVDINEVIAGFSSRGPCTFPGGAPRTCPDVSAVGVNVNAALPCVSASFPCPGGAQPCDTCYISISGTSMATPHVGGIVALLQQAKLAEKGVGLDAPGKEAETLLKFSAKDLGAAGPDNSYGWGLAKGRDALDLLRSEGNTLDLRPTFGVGAPEIRASQTNAVSFSVLNLGVAVDGHLFLRIRQVDTGTCPPACEDILVADRPVSLSRFQEALASYAFVGADHQAGRYVVDGRFDYTYTDPQDNQVKSDSIERTGSFVLKKVSWQKVRGVPSSLHVGEPVMATMRLLNTGNEDATNVVLYHHTPATGLVPLPVVPPGVGAFGAFADPSPSGVFPFNPTGDQVLYYWTIGSVPAGTAWEVRLNYAAGKPGTHTLVGLLEYRDGASQAYSEAWNTAHVVGLP